jgi:hypothetical protein
VINLNRIPEYQKARNRENGAIAALLNQADRPLLIAESEQTIDVLSLSHHLNPTVRVQILSGDRGSLDLNQDLDYLAQCRSTFFLNPSALLKQNVGRESGFTLREIYQPDLLTSDDLYLSLWQLQNLHRSCQNNLTFTPRNCA